MAVNSCTYITLETVQHALSISAIRTNFDSLLVMRRIEMIHEAESGHLQPASLPDTPVSVYKRRAACNGRERVAIMLMHAVV